MVQAVPNILPRSLDLFDFNFYRAANPELANLSNEELAEQFLNEGLAQGRPFSLAFDLDFYKLANPDLQNLPNNELINDFFDDGLELGRRFSPIFDLDYYLAQNPDLESLENDDALQHFLSFGLLENRDFSRLLDLDYYRSANPGLAAAGITTNQQLLQHFILFGIDEGRDFSPLFDFDFYRQENPELGNISNKALLNEFVANGIDEGGQFSPYFDLDYYRAKNPQIEASEEFQQLVEESDKSVNRLLFEHFLETGLEEGLSFSPFIDLSYYESSNPDLANFNLSNQELLQHFVRYGLEEGRRFSPFFNLEFYRLFNGDLVAAGLNNRQLFEHVQENGLAEGRRISLTFDPKFYLENNPDLVPSGVTLANSLEHYLVRGQAQRRRPSLFYDQEAIESLILTDSDGTIRRWDTQEGGTLTYSFVTTSSSFLYEGQESSVGEVSEEIKNNVRTIMQEYNAVLPFNLVEVPDRPPNVGQIRIMFSDGPAYAYAYFPDPPDATVVTPDDGTDGDGTDGDGTDGETPTQTTETLKSLAGDIHLSRDFENTPGRAFAGDPGTFGYETLVHQIGHALGLKHPNIYGSFPFNDRGDVANSATLSFLKDNNTNTAMSYNTAGIGASTPMSYDVRALQFIYGVSNFNNGDSVYTFTDDNFIGVKQTLWDADGIDTLDFRAVRRLPPNDAFFFDMNEGGFLTPTTALNGATYRAIGDASGRTYTAASYATSIAFGSIIENLVGSDLNDQILGNPAANQINAGEGADVITGGKGADIISGGGGVDRFIVAPGDGGSTPAGADTITDFRPGEDLIGLGAGLTFAGIQIEASGADSLIRLAGGGEYLARLRGVPVASLSAANFITLG